jgi:hypothetical protein
VLPAYGWTLFGLFFLLGLGAVLAVPVFACLWHEDGCLNRRRQRRL